MRSGMAYLTIENAPDTMKKVAEFAGTIRSTRGENFRAIVSSNSIRVIARQEALNKFKETFRAKEIISYSAKLAEICLLLPFGAKTLGEIATAITAQLSLNRVNMAGIFVCPPEDIIIVSENDAARTSEALQQLLKEGTRSQVRKVKGLRNGFTKREILLEILRQIGRAHV